MDVAREGPEAGSEAGVQGREDVPLFRHPMGQQAQYGPGVPGLGAAGANSQVGVNTGSWRTKGPTVPPT